jgi:hypothetical protein
VRVKIKILSELNVDVSAPNSNTIATDHRDLEVRRKALVADVEKLTAGWMPDDVVLAAAPLIDNWYTDFYPGSRDVCLVGAVTGHPRLGDQIVTTSPLVAINPLHRWVRTHGRFYRLGRRAAFKSVDTESSEWKAIDV